MLSILPTLSLQLFAVWVARLLLDVFLFSLLSRPTNNPSPLPSTPFLRIGFVHQDWKGRVASQTTAGASYCCVLNTHTYQVGKSEFSSSNHRVGGVLIQEE